MPRSFSLYIIVIAFMLAVCCRVAAQSNQTVNNGDATTAVSFPASTCVYNWVNNTPGIGLPASGSGNIASFTAINTGSSPITATITATPTPVGYAYIGNYGDGSLSVINTATNTVVATIPLSGKPGGLSASPDGARLYIANENDNSLSVIDTKTNTLIKTVPIGSDPSSVAVSPDGNLIYVANVADNDITVVAASGYTVLGIITGFNQPYFVAANPVKKFLYVANSPLGTVSVVSTQTNAIVKTITVGNDPIQILVSPDGSKVYVTNQFSNTISVIDAATNTVTATVPVNTKPYGEAISTDGKFLYIGGSGDGTVVVMNTQTNQLTKSITVGGLPIGMSVSADGSELFVADDESPGHVSVVSTATQALTGTVAVGNNPFSLGNFTVPGPPCIGSTITFTITVDPTAATAATIVASPASGGINTCAGAPSSDPALQQFTVYGDDLSSAITLTAPPDFEISLSQTTGYGSALTLTPTGGKVTSTVVYVRSAASAPAGRQSGTVQVTSPGASTQTVTVSATINVLPVVTAPANQKVPAGTLTQAIAFAGTGNTYNWVNDTPGIGLAASGTGDIAAFTGINKGTTPVTATITVTPVLQARAYVANYYGDNVSVIDLATNSVISTIPVGGHPDGVSVSSDGTRVYVANQFDNTVSVINTATNTVLSGYPVGEGPSGIVVTPDGRQLYVANGTSGMVSVISLATGAITNSIAVGQAPYGVAISPDGKMVYVGNFTSNTVSVIPTNGVGVAATVPVGSQPVGLVVSPDSRYVYVVNQGDGTVSVIDAASNTVTATYSEGLVATGVAISPDGSRLYVTNNGAASVSVINTATNTKITSIGTGQAPYAVSLSGDGSLLYVVNNISNTVSAISTVSNSLLATIPIDRDPYSLGNFINTAAGCSGAPVTFTITVDPETPPGITATGTLSPLTTIYGTPSTSTIFTLSGKALKAGILVTAPSGFEVSTDGITFQPSLTVGTGNNIPATQMYIRLAATTPVGNNYQGNIVLSSSGTPNVDLAMPQSAVTSAPLTITADNKSKPDGAPNPVLTATYSGFVNNETPTVLTSAPVLSTTATTGSPVGQYPITVSGALASDYTITYVEGVLTIVGTIVIPNTFTPNGDGVNDTWNIKSLNTYANCSVDIFSRFGQKVYSSIGYAIPWDGTRSGAALPAGTYYYIINLKNGLSPMSGFVALLK